MSKAKQGEFLLEVRCEEIPARMLRPASRELATRTFEELMGRGLAPASVETGFTPRRLVLALQGLSEREPESEELVTGPPVTAAFDADGQPARPALGFAKRCGVAPEALERVATERGEYVAVRRQVGGRPTEEILAEVVPRVLKGLTWPKTMRWGTGEGPWVRPVHGLLALFCGETVAMELFGVSAAATSTGHPILSPEEFSVRSFGDYRRKLTTRGVEVRFEERMGRLHEEMAGRAEALDGTLVEDAELLAKLAAICEIPGILEGSFGEEYLALPREVLTTSLRDHQSAFTVERSGALLPVFLTVMDRPDDPAGTVRAGNEWVVTARLADARFFYQEDRKVPLAQRASRLDQLTFHERLGSYAEKAERLASLAALICRELGWDEEEGAVVEATQLLKADLAAEMVKELTSLQGVMGGIYAREEGYPDPVWQALYDQYLPVTVADPIPRGRLGQACALADRVDTLTGIFGLGMIPSGSKDPFGLRRSAQGAVRILLEGELPLDLELVAAQAVRLYGDRLKLGVEEILGSLRAFLADRIRYLLGRKGYAYDEIEAALAAGSSNLPDLESRVAALHEVREDPSFLSIVLAAKRIANIIKGSPSFEIEEGVLTEDAEVALLQALANLKEDVEEAEAARQYARTLRTIASLAEVLDRFFVEILVMAEDPRLKRNRIALLQEIQRTLSRTAHLTEMVVEKSAGA